MPPFHSGPSHRRIVAQTFVEILVTVSVLGLASAGIIGLFLSMNRSASNVRVMNLAKAEVQSRIQQVAAVSYAPEDFPVVVPQILEVGNTTTETDIGSTASPIGSIPATVTWQVAAEPNPLDVPIRRVTCSISYQFHGRTQTYEMVTMRAPD